MPGECIRNNSKIRLILSFAFFLACVAGLAVNPALAQTEDPSWRQKLGTFRVGILAAGRPVLETRRVQPFREALQGVLGIPVEIFAASDYNALIEAHRGARIEYAVYSASAFSAAWLLCKCVTPVAAPTASNESTGFRSVLIARKSAARSIAGLRDATILVPGEDSFSGSVFPRDRLAREGIDTVARGWALRDMKTMDAALAAFITGEGDALFGWQGGEGNASSQDSVLSLDTMDRLQEIKDQLEIIWTSPPVPFGPHAIRDNVPVEAKSLILPFLIGLSKDDPDAYEAIETRHTGGFQPVSFEDYRPVVDALRKTLLFANPAKD